MKRSVWHALLAVVAGLCVTGAAYAADQAASPAAYEEGSYVSNEVATLRAEVDALHRQLDATMTTGYDQDGKKPAPKAEATAGCGCNPCCGDCCGCCNQCCNQCCDGCCDCCNGCCCDQGHVVLDFESTWFRYHRADGFENSNVFDFEFSPRVTVGYVSSCGLGARVRWWEYNHSGYDASLGDVRVDTFNLDFEVFEEVALGCSTGLEWSAGIRYNEFLEKSDSLYGQSFSAPGILLGARIYRSLPIGGAVFAGVRTAWLMSDWRNGYAEEINFDVTRMISEATIGYEYRTCLSNGAVLALRAAVEMQHWENFSVDRQDVIEEPVDVGFGGFVFGGSLTY